MGAVHRRRKVLTMFRFLDSVADIADADLGFRWVPVEISALFLDGADIERDFAAASFLV